MQAEAPMVRTPLHRFWLIAAGVLAMVAHDAAAQPACRLALAGAADLSSNAKSSKQLVDVTLNAIPTRLVVDTGSASLLLTDAIFARATTDTAIGLLGSSGDSAQEGYVRGIGGAREVRLGTIQRLGIGQAHGAFQATIVDQPDFYGGSGLLGMSVLGNFDLDFDLTRHRLRLFSARGDCDAPAVALDGNLYAIPMLGGYASPLKVMIDVAINGHVLKALLDTGSPGTLVFRSAAAAAGLAPTNKAFTITGAGGKSSAQVQRVDTLSVGPITLRNHLVAVDSEDVGGQDMLLGMDFFRKFHVWISNSSRQVILQYPPAPSPAMGGG